MIDTTPTAGSPPASLESVLITAALKLRPSRPPDYKTENAALVALAQHMGDSPRTILPKLAEVALEICRAGSAGISLVSEEDGDFHWLAIAGAWKPYIGGGTPCNFGPCGVALERDSVQLFTHPERYFPYLVPVSPPIAEALLTPFYILGKAVGTVWVIAHDDLRKFDDEDVRLLVSLGGFAAAAYPLCSSLDKQELQSHTLRDVNEGLLVSSVRQHELTEIAEKAEASLREIEQRLRLAGAAAKVGTWRLDLSTRCDTRDANFNRLLELEPVDSTQHFDDFLGRLHPQDRTAFAEEIENAVGARGPYKFECRFLLPDGTIRWLLNQGHVIANEGDPLYITGAVVDITIQKGIEDRLRLANEDLEQFGYSASHDLQEPIRNINVFAQLLSRRSGHLLDQQGRDFLGFISEGALRMQMLLKDLRSYAQSGQVDGGGREEVHMEMVLAKALSDLSLAVSESGAEICHSPLPVIWASPVPLGQLFQNLIGNALKYRQDDVPPRIHISASREPDQWVFAIRDNGIGIAPEHQDRIFGIFMRLHGDKKYAGSGIGLAICQKIVQRNGGRIWVESQGNGMGSTFYFTVPAGDGL